MTTQQPTGRPPAGGPPSVEQIRTAWDAIADGFDTYVTPLSMVQGEQVLDRAEIRTGSTFLDVAAGTGALSIPAARRGAVVTAVDIAPRMIKRLRDRAAAEGLDIDGRVVDCNALDLADDSFDITASQNGVTMAPVRPALAEMVRVTKPGGTVLVAALASMAKAEFLRFFLGAIKSAVPDAPVPPPDQPPVPFQLADPAVFAAVFTEAGLVDVQIDVVDWPMTFATGDDLWNEIQSSNPIGAQLIAGLSQSQRQTVRDVLGGMVRERAADQSAAVLHAEVNIGTGRKPPRRSDRH